VVVDVGSDFVKAIYDLEGDGILALECYSIMNTLWQRIDIIRSAANQNDGTILSVCSKLDEVFARNKFAENRKLFHDMLNHAKDIVRPMFKYYLERFDEEKGILKDLVLMFKAYAMFDVRLGGLVNLDMARLDTLAKIDSFKNLVPGMKIFRKRITK
jgi:hypothetical protein